MLPAAPYTVPDPPRDALRPWRARYLRRVVRIVLDWPFPLEGWLAQAWRSVRGPLADVLRTEPAAFYGALSLPTIAAPVCGGDLLTAMPQLLLELARRRVLDEQGIFWGAPVTRLVSPVLGVSQMYHPARIGMLFSPGVVTVSPTEDWELRGGMADGSFSRLAEGGWLIRSDTNPLAMHEAHPGKLGNALSLGDASVDTWIASIDDARARIRRWLPALADEHAWILSGVAPVGTHAEQSLSASYKEAIGLAYLSLHPSSLTMTEALIHETQHSKANLLSWCDPLIENSGESFPSPVRPDPRPLWGVLLAVHAFLPVALLHRAMIAAGDPLADPERYRALLRLNHDGMETLRQHARPTPVGKVVVHGMDALEAALWSERG